MMQGLRYMTLNSQIMAPDGSITRFIACLDVCLCGVATDGNRWASARHGIGNLDCASPKNQNSHRNINEKKKKKDMCCDTCTNENCRWLVLHAGCALGPFVCTFSCAG